MTSELSASLGSRPESSFRLWLSGEERENKEDRTETYKDMSKSVVYWIKVLYTDMHSTCYSCAKEKNNNNNN